MRMRKKILLIDGHSMLNRAFYGIPDLTNKEGLHTNAVYGFLNIMFSIMEEEKPDYMAVAFDLPHPTFRHEMYGEYKGTRKSAPQEFKEQVPLMKEVLTAMQIPLLMKEGYEADDLLGTLAKRSQRDGLQVTVLSGDRDLLQLADDHILIRIPKTKGGKTSIENYYPKDVEALYQVNPTEFIDVKALMGDASDNIPGLPGVGEKTAVKIIKEFKSIENAYASLEDIKPKKAQTAMKDHYDLACLSKKLATICLDVDIDFSVEKAGLENLYNEEAYRIFRRLEFKNFLSKFEVNPDQELKTETVQITEEKAMNDLVKRLQEVFSLDGSSSIGVALLGEERVYGLAMSLEEEKKEENLFLLLGEGLSLQKVQEAMSELQKAGYRLALMDVKAYLNMGFSNVDENFSDIHLKAYLLNPLKSRYSYEDLASEYLQLSLPSKEELLGRGKSEKLIDSSLKEAIEATVLEAFVCRKTDGLLTETLKKEGMYYLYEDIEFPLLFTLYDMECAGILTDGDSLKEYSAKLSVRIEELEKEIYKEAGEEFNINSPKQLGVILFEKLGLKGGKKTKTGYSTAADILEKLAPDHKIIRDILEYRQLTKLKSTYADGLVTFIREDGRIHSTFNQTITATGRISSTEPNLQNIPVKMELGRMIRKVFVPREGYIFLDADYSQIELRVLAHLSHDEQLLKAFNENQDIHTLTASQVFHVPFEEVTPLQRRNAKAVNFGIIYGISAFGLSQDLNISTKEAAEYIERYFESYPGIKAYLDGLVAFAKEHGYVQTMYHRKRPVPEISSSNFMQRSFGERIAMNSPIQGSAADIIKVAMIHVNKILKEKGLKSRLILQVHDELLIETKIEEVAIVSEILKSEMEQAALMSVDLAVDMHSGKNWYEAK